MTLLDNVAVVKYTMAYSGSITHVRMRGRGMGCLRLLPVHMLAQDVTVGNPTDVGDGSFSHDAVSPSSTMLPKASGRAGGLCH